MAAGIGVGSVLAFAGPARADTPTVVNGGFEQPAIANGTFALSPSIPGWTLEKGTSIETQNHVAGSPYEGDQFVELDSDASSGIYQDVATTAGSSYTLQLAFSPRPGTGPADNTLTVRFGGVTVLVNTRDGSKLGDTNWDVFNIPVTATAATSRIELIDTSSLSNSVGVYVDDVSLVPPPAAALPEAPMAVGIPLAGAAVFGFAFWRRRRSA